MERAKEGFFCLMVAACFVAGIVTAAQAASNDDVATLKKQVAELQAQVMTLQKQLDQKPAAAAQMAPAMGSPSAAHPIVYDQWDPMAEMQAMQRQMQQMMGNGFGPMMPGPRIPGFNPDYDIRETKTNYVVTFDAPGMDKSKINVEVRNGVLIVSGERASQAEENQPNRFYRQERSFGYFSRSIPLPGDAKADSVQAKYDSGVLTVTVDKKEAAKPKDENVKKIEVK